MLDITSDNPYTQASYLDKLRETQTLFLTDLDGTFATRLSTTGELGDRAAVRRYLDRHGFVAGAVTARTPALTMSTAIYHASCKNGFTEAEPHWGIDQDKKRIFVPLEELPFFAHSLDWDMVAGMGSGVFPRNGQGYLLDREFDNILNYDYAGYRPAVYGPKQLPKLEEHVPWRQAALAFLADNWKQAHDHFSALESSENYREGKTDVEPLPYRIQLGFKGVEGLARLRGLKDIIRERKSAQDPIAMRMAVADESKPNDDLEQATYTLYLMPYAARKERMINHLIVRSAAAAHVPLAKLRLFYAGDTPTDLRAGLYASGGAPLTFLLATGSILGPYLLERRPYFGNESLGFLWESNQRVKRRFAKTDQKGVYTFKVSGRRWVNTIVIGDEKYPGMTPPGSVRAFLEEFSKPNAGP